MITALVFCGGALVGWFAYSHWSERRWIARAQRQESALHRARVINIVAAEVLAQVERKRVTVDRMGFALVTASCPEEAATIMSQSAAFGAREKAARVTP
jgi:hypothetical protein